MLNVYTRNASKPTEYCIVWMHGLGANAQDMVFVAEELKLDQSTIRHVFLDAPTRPVTINQGIRMQAWYDILGFGDRQNEDAEGIRDSFKAITEVIEAEIKQGLDAEKIFLAGFSQGAAMALYTALHLNLSLGGVIALSGYLPLASKAQTLLAKNTPIFIGYGNQDPVVIPDWTRLTVEWLRLKSYTNLSVQTYSMDHTICLQEILDLSNWLTSLKSN